MACGETAEEVGIRSGPYGLVEAGNLIEAAQNRVT